jgi:hypothetical protein
MQRPSSAIGHGGNRIIHARPKASITGILFVVLVCCASAEAGQMEGPTIYYVDPSNAVISDDGSEAYYMEPVWSDFRVISCTLTRLNLIENTTAKINLESRVTGKEFQLAGFAPGGELIGYSQTKLWSYDRSKQALRVVFASPKRQKIRYATVQKATSSVLISLAPKDYPDDSSEETLSFSIHDLVKVTWRDNQIAQEAIRTRREVLPPGAVFDSDDTLFFPMRDVYQCRFIKIDMPMPDGLEGGRCLPLSTEVVFTAGGSPSTLGARSIAVSKKMIYVYVNRLGGSGEGYMVRFHKLDQLRSFTNHDDYETIVTICSKALASIEVLQKEVSGAALCASADGRHVLMQCNGKWFVITDDGQPVSLSPKETSSQVTSEHVSSNAHR